MWIACGLHLIALCATTVRMFSMVEALRCVCGTASSCLFIFLRVLLDCHGFGVARVLHVVMVLIPVVISIKSRGLLCVCVCARLAVGLEPYKPECRSVSSSWA